MRTAIHKLYLILLLIFLLGKQTMGQSTVVDSLKKRLDIFLQASPGYERDTQLVNIYDKLAWEISVDRPDSAIIVSDEIFKIAHAFLENEDLDLEQFLKQTQPQISAQQKWYIIALARQYHNLGEFHRLRGSYPAAIESSLKALAIWDKINDKNTLSQKAATLANIGIFYSERSDYVKALYYYTKAVEIDKQTNDKGGLAADMGNMAIVYAEQNNYSKALDLFHEALKINEELGNKKGIAAKLGNIGIIYKRQAEYLSLQRSSSSEQINDLYRKAAEYFSKAQMLNEQLGNNHGISINLGNLGNLYLQTGEYKKAETSFFSSLDIDQKIGFKAHEMDNYRSLYSLYDSIGNEKLGYAYYRKYVVLRDSLNNEDNVKKEIKTQMQYEFDKKEIARKAEQEKKDLIVQQEKQRQKIIIYSISGGLFLLIILVLIIYKSNRNKQRSNIEITRQKQLVEDKQKEIIDSINYAKRIQTSILPSDKYIERSLNKRKNK